jgi:acyl-CoA synthetase (NDP forming)
MVDKSTSNLEDLESLFYPEHIAFIGATESSALGSMLYLKDFKDSEWSDSFYPVNPSHDEVLGWKCYPSVLNIPNHVDTAYISVKTKIVPKVLEECVEKGIHWVIIFSSGFSETGETDRKKVEEQLNEIIKGSNTNLIGPNCLGPYNGITGMSFSFAARPNQGNVSFMSQSGGHLSKLLDIGVKRDMRFRYGISFGNQVDLNCVDFLRFFRKDEGTKIIAAYLESFGSSNGHQFFTELKKTTNKKPVLLWKGGYTEDGSRAAFSHTAAIASDFKMWKSMAKQTGATLIRDNEEFWNTIKTFELLYPERMPQGRGVGIITPGGGSSVNITDLFSSHNLKVPVLTEESQEKLSKILPKENVNIKNPIDLGASGFIINIFLQCIEIVIQDPQIDIIMIPLWKQHIFRYVFKRMIKLQKSTTKPFAFCLPSLADSIELVKKFNRAKKLLHKGRVLYYLSLRDAAKSMSLLCDYRDYLISHELTLS